MLTKGQIRESALKELKYSGNNCWRQNNHTTRGRKFIGRLGVSDIIGMDGAARWVACEVKTIADRLSPEQTEFLEEIATKGGVAYIATENKFGKVELIHWELFKNKL